MTGTPEQICAEIGHDWIIHDGIAWDTAECLTCGRKIRDLIIRMSELPNRRQPNPVTNIREKES